MFFALESVLPALAPKLADLVDEPSWVGLRSLAARIPALGSWGCLELRLGSGDPRIDLSISIQRGDGSEALASVLAAGTDPPEWSGVRPLLEEWILPESLLHRRVPTVWLEYDLPGGSPREPFVYLSFMSETGYEPRLSAAELREVAERALERLPGREGDQERLDLLERCVRTLPPEGRALHVAALPRWRGTQAVRVNAIVPPEALRGWLEGLGWRGDSTQWETAAALSCAGGPLQVDFDAGEPLRPDLPVAMRLHPRTTAAPWLEKLIESGAVEPARAAAALGWSGAETVVIPDADWLVRIQRQAAIKVTAGPEGRTEVKAYLAFHPSYSLF